MAARSSVWLVFAAPAAGVNRVDCSVGTYFQEFPIDQQPCMKLGDCLECTYDPLYNYSMTVGVEDKFPIETFLVFSRLSYVDTKRL